MNAKTAVLLATLWCSILSRQRGITWKQLMARICSTNVPNAKSNFQMRSRWGATILFIRDSIQLNFNIVFNREVRWLCGTSCGYECCWKSCWSSIELNCSGYWKISMPDVWQGVQEELCPDGAQEDSHGGEALRMRALRLQGHNLLLSGSPQEVEEVSRGHITNNHGFQLHKNNDAGIDWFSSTHPDKTTFLYERWFNKKNTSLQPEGSIAIMTLSVFCSSAANVICLVGHE